MKKKLLLSFAVFATAMSVNAQKPLYKGIAKKSMSVEFQTNAVIESKTEINPIVMSNSSSNKRLVTKTIKDTLSIVGNKKTYGYPDHAYNLRRTMKLKLYKSGSNTEFLSANQRYDNTQPLKLNGFGVSLTAYHDNTPVVALVFLRSKKTKELDSIIPVELSINAVKSTSGAITYSTRWFKPTTPISISDTFMIEVFPRDKTDSLGITATGAYYGSTRAVAKIDGTTLTVNSTFPEDDSTYYGWGLDNKGYFKGGFLAWNSTLNDFFVTGKNVLPGTYITAQTGAFTYTVNKTQTVAQTDINQNLKVYNTYNGSLGVDALTDGKTSFNYYMAYDDGIKGLESDWFMYPDVEYTVDSDPKANDVCKGTDGSVSVTFDAKNRNVLENPTLSKLAFFQKYLGLDKSKNYFYSTVQNGKGSTKFVGIIDFKSTSLTINATLDSLNKLDTLFMVDYILPYGFSKPAAPVTLGHLFPVSSKVSAEALVSSAIKCNGGDAEVIVSATGGTAAYIGTGVKLAVKAGNASYDVTDANGCKGTATINVTEPTKLVALALVSSAIKCNGGDAEVTVSAFGGTPAYTGYGNTPYKGIGKQLVKAGNLSFEVTDDKGCKETATINVTEPTTLTVVASEVSKASNDNTKDGKAKVVATGGTSPYTYVWSANAGSTSEVTVSKGNYTVVVTDINGCVKDGAVVITAGTASISELAIEGLSIYPNPTSTNLTVAFSSKGSASIELVNVAGQVVDTKNTTGVSNTSFDMTSLETGVYFVNIKVAEGTAIFKVVKD